MERIKMFLRKYRDYVYALVIIVLLIAIPRNTSVTYVPQSVKDIDGQESLTIAPKSTFENFVDNYDSWVTTACTYTYTQEMSLDGEYYNLNNAFCESDYCCVLKPNYTLELLGDKACLSTASMSSGFEVVPECAKELVASNDIKTSTSSAVGNLLNYIALEDYYNLSEDTDSFTINCCNKGDAGLQLKAVTQPNLVDWDITAYFDGNTLRMVVVYDYSLQGQDKKETFTYSISKVPTGIATIKHSTEMDYIKSTTLSQVYYNIFDKGDNQ